MENERLNGLLAYLESLASIEAAGVLSRREIHECIVAVREELNIGLGVEFNREGRWNIVEAAKREGAERKEIDSYIVRNGESVSDKISELRSRGYRIFYVAQGIGIVDDFHS